MVIFYRQTPSHLIHSQLPEKDIPLLIGSNLNEWTPMSLLWGEDKGKTFSDAEIEERLQAVYGDNKVQFVEDFLNAYPLKTKLDALYFDTFIRLPMLKIMTHKADQGRGSCIRLCFYIRISPGISHG